MTSISLKSQAFWVERYQKEFELCIKYLRLNCVECGIENHDSFLIDVSICHNKSPKIQRENQAIQISLSRSLPRTIQ
jgi:hypothetical protein